MADKQKQAEWLLQADFCRKMAERATDPERKIVWLNLAHQWLTLGNPNELESGAGQFTAAGRNKATGQDTPSTRN